ncbi:MAG: phosphate ABC transporter substrate-binding/OmpA family protein [Rhodobacteraceae bacterium]|nr:phosphate ABC transporter substrate-binding/OmpA family protein [Paracoccaceae bacterium]
MKRPDLKTLLCTALIAVAPVAINAQQVVLQSLDGTISVTGELTEYDSENYVIRTNIGEMTIPVSQVTCIGADCPEITPDFTEFTISGARSLALNLLPDLLDGFGRSLELDVTHLTQADGSPKVLFTDFDGNEVAEISFLMNGSTSGISDLVTSQASIALTTRPMRPEEASAISAAGLGDIFAPGLENILALDGLVIVTSTQNGVHIISEDQIAKVFSGEVTNWSELGGDDAQINLYVRPENSDTGALLSQFVLRPVSARLSRNVIELASDSAVSDAVSSDPYGIGFTTFSNERSARSMSILGACGIQSPANDFTIKTEEYPFTRRLYLYRLANNVPVLANKFIEYLDSVEAQRIVAFSGFAGQGVVEESVNNQGLRFLAAMLPTDAEASLAEIQNMMVELGTARRLTLTYRFDQNTSQLDSRSKADIIRLARGIEDGQISSREIILIGFTDSVGEGVVNKSLSLTRAEQVREALLLELASGSFAEENIRAVGYGELSPLSCDAGLTGRQINQRVEVWTR